MVTILYIGNNSRELSRAVDGYNAKTPENPWVAVCLPTSFASSDIELTERLRDEGISKVRFDGIALDFSWKGSIGVIKDTFPDSYRILIHGHPKKTYCVDAHVSTESDVPKMLEELLENTK
ncbi:MAG: hypothetical protein AABX51_05645 [Nanoarchaeota archaeon]